MSGAAVGKTQHLQPFELISGLLTTAGVALLYILEVDSSKGRYIGAQILGGFGLGLGNQIPITAVQGLSKPEDMTSSSGIVLSKLSFPFQRQPNTSPPNFKSSDASPQRCLLHSDRTVLMG